MLKKLGAAALLATAPVLSAAAQENRPDGEGGLNGFIAGGIGIAPDYEGSDDYQAIPLVFTRFAYRGVGVEVEGFGGRVDVSPFENIGFGPAFNYRMGRDDVDDDQVDALEDVDDAFEIGGFLRFGQPIGLLTADEAVARFDVLADVADGHSGVLATAGAAYTFRPIDDLGLTFGTSATWASEDYADAFFSVTPQGAAASGLAPFEAGSGIKDVGLNVAATYALTDRWGLVATGSTSFLVGDAADSPIVDDAGSSVQFFGGVALSYSF